MGNYVSCTLSTPLAKYSRSAKVILPGGEIKQIQAPVKAAEQMLENPNFFVVNTQSLKIGSRFSPLGADEDLEVRNVYVMFPMKRVASKVTAADIAALFLTANNAPKRSLFSGKLSILPDCNGEGDRNNCSDQPEKGSPKLNFADIEEYSHPEFMYRMSFSRSKKPLLETIAEEPIYTR